jgi:protein phosphatase 1A
LRSTTDSKTDTFTIIGIVLTEDSGSRKVAHHAKRHIRELLFEGDALQAGRYEDAIRQAIQKEEETLLEECQEGENKFAISGSTVSVVIVNLNKGVMVVGNLGDSHVLMGECDITGQLETVVCAHPEYYRK